MSYKIEKLMEESGVGFGTSGARGLVSAMTDRICFAYTKAFLQHLIAQGSVTSGSGVAFAGDYRPSSERIMKAVAAAIIDSDCTPIYCGTIPSPAVALYGIAKGIPAIMVTGSHIPDDRNGIKFNKASGEINKSDEAGIKSQTIAIDESRFDALGMTVEEWVLPALNSEAIEVYEQRYIHFFGADALAGISLGLYEHSTVGRESMFRVFSALGASVTKLGFSETFIPVDTEAIRPQDVALAKEWAATGNYDALISADGDCDRPLLSTEKGEWFRGDVLGVLCAEYLGADAIATPVSCNTLVEKTELFKSIVRTRIGSPYVIEGMEQLDSQFQAVVGYEANGGFLTQSVLSHNGAQLSPLPTRDAFLPIIAVLLLSKERKSTLSALAVNYPKRFTASDRVKEFPTDKSQKILSQFNTGSEQGDFSAIEQIFKDMCGNVDTINRTDGLRITFKNGEIVHLRPSGNAPEFRCYAEAESEERAVELTQKVLLRLKEL